LYGANPLTVKRRIVDQVADNSANAEIDEILDYWFEGCPTDAGCLKALMKKWFAGSADNDRELSERFGAIASAAAAGELMHWSETARGRLALILLLDQLPRNLHRGTAAAFAQDGKALALALDGIAQRQDRELDPLQRIFFLMPLQHAESRETQARSTAAFESLASEYRSGSAGPLLENTAKFAFDHREIVDRFGRFPHRNRVLGRESTDEELKFLASGSPSFGQ
jgi:uncharacterized protein (DUF924 family)